MNKVITINLNGNAYQLEEGGYEALRAYLEGAGRRLEVNPDRDEIISDIEQAIAEKCLALLGPHKTVVGANEVAQIIDEMGPVEEPTGAAADAPPTGSSAGAGPGTGGAPDPATKAATPVRRLYRIMDGALIGGVCTGLGAYLNVDPPLMRVAFVLLAVFAWGVPILVYFVLMFLVPVADTTAEKAAARGWPSTAQEFIRRAMAGHYAGTKGFANRQERRAWKRRCKREMHGWARGWAGQMRENAQHWQWGGWSRPPGPVPAPGIGTWLAFPLLAFLEAGLAILGFFAVVSLLVTRAVFGVPLPGGMHLWVGILLLICLFQLVAWPIRMMRHACSHRLGGDYAWGPRIFGWCDSLCWICFWVFMVWGADRYIPPVHAALREIAPAIREFFHEIKEWVNQLSK